METHNLVREIGTRYIYGSYEEKFKELMAEYSDEGFTMVDMADARITPDIAVLINQYNKGNIQFIDSKCKDTNAILSYNYQISSMEGMQKDNLPEYTIGGDPLEYIQGLSEDKIYTIDGSKIDVEIPLMALAIMTRPSLNLSITQYLDSILKGFTKILHLEGPTRITDTTSEFQYYYKGSFIEFSTDVKDENTLFHVYGIGYVTWASLVEEYLVVPQYLGKENVFTIDEELWIPVLDGVLETLSKIKKPITLVQFVKGEDLED